jgi:prephenate dehydrogenase
MQKPFREFHIAIFGLGLMGGSLAMALKGKCARLDGIDPDPGTRALATKMGLVDSISASPGAQTGGADMLILAAPVRVILSIIRSLPDLHPGKAIVMDIGSTKREILHAMESLPARFDPIGSHPMCGKEHSSLAFADPAIFENAPFALTPLPRTSQAARTAAENIVRLTGAKLLWVNPNDHDRWTSITSHFPYLLSNILAGITPIEASAVVGSGYRSTARLAATSPGMMLDIYATNRDNILEQIRHFRERLDTAEKLVGEQNEEGLLDFFNLGRETYKEIFG